jgi:hypothetical protein
MYAEIDEMFEKAACHDFLSDDDDGEQTEVSVT